MSDKPELIKVDLGPYASLLYKYDLFHDEEYRLDSSKGLKFLHFNSDQINKKTPKRIFNIYQNRTVAALALSPNGIRKTVADFLALPADQELFIPVAVGVSFVSKDDNYSKAKGRDESVRQMAEVDIKVNGVTINDTHIFIHLAPYKGVNLAFRVNKKTGFSTVVGHLAGVPR